MNIQLKPQTIAHIKFLADRRKITPEEYITRLLDSWAAAIDLPGDFKWEDFGKNVSISKGGSLRAPEPHDPNLDTLDADKEFWRRYDELKAQLGREPRPSEYGAITEDIANRIYGQQ